VGRPAKLKGASPDNQTTFRALRLDGRPAPLFRFLIVSPIMAEKRPKRPCDVNQWAKRLVDIATGAVEDREPTPEEQGKDPAAVSSGRRGGLKGGKARAASMTPEQRSELAKKQRLSAGRIGHNEVKLMLSAKAGNNLLFIKVPIIR
jgi:hypothetical protein